MIPAEIIPLPGNIELDAVVPQITLEVANTGDRPIQVGSRYHFRETADGLGFDRGRAREVRLVPLPGTRTVFGFQGRIMGPL